MRRQDGGNYTDGGDGTDETPATTTEDDGTTTDNTLVARWTTYDSWMNQLDGSRSVIGIPWTNEVAKGWSKVGPLSKKLIGLYTWTEWIPVECAKYGLRCFPMLKNNKSDKISAFKSKIKWGTQGKASQYMMGPNECNLASQGNLTPAQAATVIKTYMYPLLSKAPNDGGYLLVGPSVANGASGQAWMDKFVKEQSAVWDKVAVQSVHCYSPDVASIKAWMKLAHDRWGKPIFLTEYGCQSFTSSKTCTSAQALAMAKDLKAYCEANSWCRGVFPYSTFVTSRVGVNKVNAMFSNSNGDLTSLGKSLLAV
ncbi:glycosyl hydrolase catalytic core-domain-containing protein [Auriculariales sp. MPI-PUGE-AT-0066]|nr:glycosyl hydrolase catalytic core-domain-containing protein [Auriculariales sp. MPI-PUGE-AT-0066]